jgi:hypothetical protein
MSQLVVIDDWFQGEDRVFQFTVKDKLGAIVNITGWTFSWEVRTYAAAGTSTLTKTSAGGGVVITDAPNGQVEVRIVRADTQAIAPADYQHALARTNAGAWTVLADGLARLSAAAAKT